MGEPLEGGENGKDIAIAIEGGFMEFRSINSKYEVSDTGIVRNSSTKRELKGSKDKDGYLRVYIPETKFGHRLVAEMFIPNTGLNPDGTSISGRLCINHKDENKENNSVENLEWCDDTYNKAYSGIKVQCVETGEIFTSFSNAERHYGIYKGEIKKVVNTKYKAKFHFITI